MNMPIRFGDLLHLEPEFVKQVREQLPADGKAEGFDRMSSALFFDETQMEQYLAVADFVARRAIQDTPPEVKKDEFLHADKLKYPKETLMVPNIKTKTEVERGYIAYKLRDGGVEVWSQGNYDHNKTGFGFLQSAIINSALYGVEKLVTQVMAITRIRIKAGGFPLEKAQVANPFGCALLWAANSPNESKHYIEIKGTLDKPRDRGGDGISSRRCGGAEAQHVHRLEWITTTQIINAEEGKFFRPRTKAARPLRRLSRTMFPKRSWPRSRPKARRSWRTCITTIMGRARFPIHAV